MNTNGSVNGWMLPAVLLTLVSVLGTGCIGFSGPQDVRHAICASCDHRIELEKQEAISVGPLAIGAAQLIAGNHIPPVLDGIGWVDYGHYRINHLSADESLSLRDLDMKGWEPVVRIRERGEEMVFMINSSGDTLRKVLFIQKEGEELQIFKVQGNFQKLIDYAMDHADAALDDGDFDFDGMWDDTDVEEVDF